VVDGRRGVCAPADSRVGEEIRKRREVGLRARVELVFADCEEPQPGRAPHGDERRDGNREDEGVFSGRRDGDLTPCGREKRDGERSGGE
jgi:hypothetical protein